MIFLTKSVMAHCPLCVAATGAAVAVTRAYGIDDLIVGLFVGGVVISTALWLDTILKKRNKGKNHIPLQSMIIVFLSIVSTVVSFYFAGMLGNVYPVYLIFGLDKILVGTLLGSFITLATFQFNDSFLRRLNGNKNFVPFQPIILTTAFLSLASLIFFFLGLIV